MIQGEGEIVRKGGGEGKADKGQLGKEENQAERQQETQGSPVQPLRGRNQGAVLFPDALLPEKQVKEKGDQRGNQQDEAGNASAPVLEAAHELVIQVHREGFDLSRNLHGNPVIRKNQGEAGKKGGDQGDSQIGERQTEKGADPSDAQDGGGIVRTLVLVMQGVVENQKGGREGGHHGSQNQPGKAADFDPQPQEQVQKAVGAEQDPEPEAYGDGGHQHAQGQKNDKDLPAAQGGGLQQIRGRQRQQGCDGRGSRGIEQGIYDRLAEIPVPGNKGPVLSGNLERQGEKRQDGEKKNTADGDQPEGFMPECPSGPQDQMLHWILSSMLRTFRSRCSAINRRTKSFAG